MIKDLVFFGENGITNTSANYISNIAKEQYQAYEKSLSSLQFYNESVGFIGGKETSVLSIGTDMTTLAAVPDTIEKIAQCKALIAYLREAIKARESLKKEVQSLTLADYCKGKGIDFPKEPEKEVPLTEDRYYGSLSIKERNAYYTLEAYCATLGKLIHPDGALSNSRQELMDKINKPHDISGSGRDSIIYNYTPSVELEEVDKVFYALQDKYRSLQSQLNSIKHECMTAIEESETKCETEFMTKYHEYLSKVDTLTKEFNKFKQDETIHIGKLKIVIPDKLKNIYEFVSSLGKK